MVYTFCVDPGLLEAIDAETDLDLWLVEADRVYKSIYLRGVFADCGEEATRNRVGKRLKFLGDVFDQSRRKELEVTWMRYLYEMPHLTGGKCDCENPDLCAAKDIVTKLKFGDRIPVDALITHQPTQDTRSIGMELIDLKSPNASPIFQICEKRIPYEVTKPNLESNGIKEIEKVWGPLISISKKITILDRNVFGMWNTNFEGGLRQFSLVLAKLNPGVTFEIITAYRSQHNEHGKPNSRFETTVDYDIKRWIEPIIKGLRSPKISMILCKGGLPHERYILFDKQIGAELGRGLDTFMPVGGDGQTPHLVYLDPQWVNSKVNTQNQGRINAGKDFGPIRNF